jgi:hypothetical protein
MTERDATNWLLVLGVCVVQYWTVLERDDTLHFRYATALYFGSMAHLLYNLIRQNAERAAAAPSAAAAP